MNTETIKKMIARRAERNRDKAAEIRQHHNTMNQGSGDACTQAAIILENLLTDIEILEAREKT